ncbi:MAG: helix-turn-helix transcriptional regulator [Acidobacteriota bacterium]
MGSKGYASDIINGKREISKSQARKLAEFFNVSVELFI